jgi:hypothetical protein
VPSDEAVQTIVIWASDLGSLSTPVLMKLDNVRPRKENSLLSTIS